MTASALRSSFLLDRLPSVKGSLRGEVPLSDVTWFRVGGNAQVLFMPADAQDLIAFLKAKPQDIPLNILGVGSNVLVRDGGIDGVVIRLGGAFGRITIEAGNRVRAGAAALDVSVAKKALGASLAGLEFMRGIPGTVGGALRMNAGAYGRETKDVLIEAEAVDLLGNKIVLNQKDMGFSYRHCSAPHDLIFLSALYQGAKGQADEIKARMAEITDARELSQPVRSRTGGSTFKNPNPEQSGGLKAWQLIDKAGCRGLRIGDAQVSQQHCNFLINHGGATAEDIEKLGETVRFKVEKETGIDLEWEIRRIGRTKSSGAVQDNE